jgi:hypothetical protein
MRNRLQRAIDKYEDAEDRHEKWSFSLSPSERRRSWERVCKLKSKAERLAGQEAGE